ncbi:replication factor C small subunit [Candidatus Pacearchaeota archaeon CG10_big_fil_rev_8_21_14_0_10_35_13]|nr:MAG: replication factor C small subunit [Candidatus Pacearchaeota archaeon CG10_big_fil_rev_8_21_14_0_10_35_13]
MSKSNIWTEKYRPSNFDEVVGQEEVVRRVKGMTDSMNIPHLLFAGPAGIGKSTLALIVVKQLFGDTWRDNYLELNASDERGIDVIRQKVKDFARTKALASVPFKVIFLDEADALTVDAQHALRRTMENYSNTCRFVLSCNYSTKVIDPIQSRCALFRFTLLDKKDVTKIIRRIALSEGLEIDEDALEIIADASEGDARRTVNILQSTASISPKITKELIDTVVSSAKPSDVKIVLENALSGDFISARTKLLEVMLNGGFSGQDIIKGIQRELWNLPIEPEIKVRLTEKTGDIEFRLIEGSDPFIQLESLLASFVIAGKGKVM